MIKYRFEEKINYNYLPVGIMSSGVDNNGEVEVETPPKPLIILLAMVREAAEVDRTSMVALLGGMAGLASIKRK